MKFHFFLVNSLIIFIFFHQSTCSLNIREILTEFLKTTNSLNKENDNLSLSKNCLGKLSDFYIDLIIKSFEENNFDNLVKNVENLGIDIFLNCPSESLFNQLMNIEDSIITDFSSFTKNRNKTIKLSKLLASFYTDLNPSFIGKKHLVKYLFYS